MKGAMANSPLAGGMCPGSDMGPAGRRGLGVSEKSKGKMTKNMIRFWGSLFSCRT